MSRFTAGGSDASPTGGKMCRVHRAAAPLYGSLTTRLSPTSSNRTSERKHRTAPLAMCAPRKGAGPVSGEKRAMASGRWHGLPGGWTRGIMGRMPMPRARREVAILHRETGTVPGERSPGRARMPTQRTWVSRRASGDIVRGGARAPGNSERQPPQPRQRGDIDGRGESMSFNCQIRTQRLPGWSENTMQEIGEPLPPWTSASARPHEMRVSRWRSHRNSTRKSTRI